MENNIPILDIRHLSIIDALPVHNSKKEVLNVGCGDCKIDYHLVKAGYSVYSTDYEINQEYQEKMKEYFHLLNFSIADVFNYDSFPVKSVESVICSEVLEHLVNYKEAFANLLKLAERRLIITVPYQHSFDDFRSPPVGHCNYWSDMISMGYKDINEFINMAKPYATSIQKIRTKAKDVSLKQFDYLIIIDKNQKYNG